VVDELNPVNKVVIDSSSTTVRYKALLEANKLLYHYTSTEGLIGIVGNAELWATEVHFLDDRSETPYRVKRLKQLQGWLQTSSWTPQQQETVDSLIHALDRAEDVHDFMPACVVCFCESADLLSQWRGYAPNRGFAIGMDPRVLTQNSKFILKQIDYRKKRQLLELQNLVFQYLDASPSVGSPNAVEAVALNCLGHLVIHAARYKRRAFEQEKEWRLDYIFRSDDPLDSFHFRSASAGVVPFVKIKIGQNTASAIREIVIGPTRYPRDSRRGVEMLLRKNGVPLQQVRIRQSKIPIRS
jgi:hypothetical protein